MRRAEFDGLGQWACQEAAGREKLGSKTPAPAQEVGVSRGGHWRALLVFVGPSFLCGTTLVACRAHLASGLRLGHSFVEKREKRPGTKYPFNPCPIRLSDMPGQDGYGARTRRGY